MPRWFSVTPSVHLLQIFSLLLHGAFTLWWVGCVSALRGNYFSGSRFQIIDLRMLNADMTNMLNVALETW